MWLNNSTVLWRLSTPFSFLLVGSKAFTNLSYASCNCQCYVPFNFFFSVRDMLENDTVHETCQLVFYLRRKNILVY